MSISERHTSYKHVLQATFYRTLWFSGIKEPRKLFTDEERDRCQEGYSLLGLRDGAKECLEILKANGWNVWCLTTADIPRVQGYFQRGGVEMPADCFVSCDSQGVAKPALAGMTGSYTCIDEAAACGLTSFVAYRPTYERFGKDDIKFFAAAHMWDVSAATQGMSFPSILE